MSDLTRLLSTAESGDPGAAERLLPLVYAELRRLAAARLSAEPAGQTLQPTALVHEAYLRLLGPDGEALRWDHRGHFFAAAAEAMRRILVDNARRKKRQRHGGGRKRLNLADPTAPGANDDDLSALDDALTELAAEDPLAAKVVELRYFAGLGHDAVAATLGVTVYQARQKWTYARAWLREALRPDCR